MHLIPNWIINQSRFIIVIAQPDYFRIKEDQLIQTDLDNLT
jgi:hypothetical protein